MSMSTTHSVVFPSSLGWMAAAWHAGRLARFVFGRASDEEAWASLAAATRGSGDAAEDGPRDGQAESFIERMRAYADGADDPLWDIRLDLDWCTPFQRSVLEQCRRIPRGRTLSYAELATRAGSPGAARAVGQVMASNRFPLIIPCHRVVAKGGLLGGFSAPQGLRMKRLLLKREAVLVPA